MGENRKIYAALLGAGTVGSGVRSEEHTSELQSRAQSRMPSSA